MTLFSRILLRLYQSKKYIVFRQSNSGPSDELKYPDGYKLYTIKSGHELQNILGEFNINICSLYAECARRQEDGKTVLFLVLTKNKIIHYSFLNIKNNINNYDPYYEEINFEKYSIIGPCITNSEFRGKKVYPLTLGSIIRYHNEHFPSKSCLIMTKETNDASRKGILKGGFTQFKKIRMVKLLIWNLFYQIE